MYKIQKTALIFIVCLHIVRIHVRCRENRSYARRTSMLVLTRAHQVDNVCSWQLLTFHASSPHPLNKCPLSLWLYLCHCLSFFILSYGFWTPTDVFILLRLFHLFPYTNFYIFSHLRIPFYCFLLFLRIRDMKKDWC